MLSDCLWHTSTNDGDPCAYLIQHFVELLSGDGLSSWLGNGAIQGSLHALRSMQGRLQGNALPHRSPLLGPDLLLPPPRRRHLSNTAAVSASADDRTQGNRQG